MRPKHLFRRCLVIGAIVVSLGAGFPFFIRAQSPAFDLLIQGGRVIDGTGNPWFLADVGIKGDSIVAVAPRLESGGARIVDARGLVVAPGFIDVHSHAEAREDGQDIIGGAAAENNIRQGVTTIIAGPDGFGPVQVGDYLARVTAANPAINVGTFMGHGSVRASVVGHANRAATPHEMQRMRDLVRTGMREGAFGLSTGLFYVPGNYAPLDEVIELARVAGESGGIHQSHMRNEAGRVLESVRDTIIIGGKGGLPTQITHHKIVGKANWGKSVDTLRLIDQARARGVDATLDQYPYTATSTSIQAGLVPQWAQEGGRERLLERLASEGSLRKILAEVSKAIETDRGGGDPANIVLAACTWDQSLAGKSLAQVLRDRGQAVTIDLAATLVVEIVQKGGCSAIYHIVGEDDLVRIMKHPATMIASDASPGIPTPGNGVPHPRAYGTFARVLGLYVREKGVITLEDAIRKMSSFPGQRLGIFDRGILRPGMKADIAVFDAARVRDAATFERPHQYAEGISHVIVNGEMVLVGGTLTAARPGRVLHGAGARRADGAK